MALLVCLLLAVFLTALQQLGQEHHHLPLPVPRAQHQAVVHGRARPGLQHLEELRGQAPLLLCLPVLQVSLQVALQLPVLKEAWRLKCVQSGLVVMTILR